MQARIQKWGNSIGVRIPMPLAREAKLGDGTVVDLQFRNGAVVLRRESRKYSLKGLASAITDENRHDEMDWGRRRGREAW